MDHVDGPRIPQGINGAECVTTKILYHFQHPCPAKTTQHLGVAVLATSLSNVDGIAHVILDRIGKGAQIIAG